MLGYLGCALAACFILLEFRAVRQLMANTKRLDAVFRPLLPSDRVQGIATQYSQPPSTLQPGSPIPEFRARRVDGRSDTIERGALLGESAIVIFCRANEFEQWDSRHLNELLRGCRMRVDGGVYVLFPAGDDRANVIRVARAALLDTRLEELAQDVVLGADEAGSVWNAFGIQSTPCKVEIDRAGVIRRWGVIAVPETENSRTANA